MEEKEAHSIAAVAEDDGEITNYLWVQTGGADVELSGTTTSTLSFTAPSVDSDETLSFALTVEDDEGEYFGRFHIWSRKFSRSLVCIC